MPGCRIGRARESYSVVFVPMCCVMYLAGERAHAVVVAGFAVQQLALEAIATTLSSHQLRDLEGLFLAMDKVCCPCQTLQRLCCCC